jgi:DNA-binding beta-propeller fold protein YncE
MHIFPQLRKLEEKYQNQLVVIGVHSGKFHNEKENENIRQAILRHGIHHPVINDNQFIVWRMYQVQAWPTIVLIDPLGNYLGSQSGEITFDQWDPLLDAVIKKYEGQMDRTPLPMHLETLPAGTLRFPGKILANEQSQRLLISDSGRHRIVTCSFEGEDVSIIGSGKPGFTDGHPLQAQFQFPQGLVAVENTIYLADTENHSIRGIDLQEQKVTTVAGTGEKSESFPPAISTPAATALRSPWDLAYYDGVLYVAMAGSHQIFAYDIRGGSVRILAGTGAEQLKDGPAAKAAFNQPSGLATDGKSLYIADPEASAIRALELKQDAQVITLVGTGLFDFGDQDGKGKQAKLQHPLAVALQQNVLYIADTFNHKIKTLDLKTLEVKTKFGNGKPQLRDGIGLEAGFYEPSGLSIAGQKLFVADTNNHAIRVIDLQTNAVTTLNL